MCLTNNTRWHNPIRYNVRVNGYDSLPPIVAHVLEMLIVALLLLIATGVGLRLLKLQRIYAWLSVGERLLFGVTIGLGALSLLMFVIGLLDVLYLPVGVILLVALAASAYRALREIWPEAVVACRDVLKGLRYPPNLFLAGVIVLVVGVALIKALAPVATQDDLMYHMALPLRYVEAHAVGFYLDSTYSGFPQLMEMLYTWGLLLGSDRISVLLAFSAGMIGPAAAALFCRRHLRPSGDGPWRSLPLLCAALFLSVPLVGFVLRAANTDLAQASFDFLAIYAFWLFLTQRKAPNDGPLLHKGMLALCGICAALAFSTKYYGFAVAGALAISVLVFHFTGRKRSGNVRLLKGWRFLPAFFVPLVVLSSLWLARNFVATKNPTWPLSGVIFRGLYISPTATPQNPDLLLGSVPGIGLDSPWTGLQFMWQAMTRGPASIDNQVHNVDIGLLLLPALLLLIFARRNLAAWYIALFALEYWLAWAFFFSRTSARYLSTFFLLCAVLGAFGVVSLAARMRQPLARNAIGVAVGVLLVWQAISSAASVGYYLPAVFSFDRSTDRSAEETYLAAYMEDYPMMEYIAENTPRNAVIYVWDGQPRGYRVPRAYVYARLVPLYSEFGSSPEQWRARLRELGITYVLTHERAQLAPGQQPGADPLDAAATAFRERYFGPTLFSVDDYALYELK